jgi:hypothetical protein
VSALSPPYCPWFRYVAWLPWPSPWSCLVTPGIRTALCVALSWSAFLEDNPMRFEGYRERAEVLSQNFIPNVPSAGLLDLS